MKYLHTMIRISDPEESLRFFELLGLRELRRFDNEAGRFTLIFRRPPSGRWRCDPRLRRGGRVLTFGPGSGPRRAVYGASRA
jgi:catechol 2,3-dioxygenase-like lactoylglutathione lyase family enzyme